MLLTVTPLEDPGPPSPTPPPTAPKPSKDNARLQRLLRKAAKRSGLQQPSSQPPKSFRSTLSPVNEGDLESPEPVSPHKFVPPPLNLPPRFQIRPMTHRVPSPYPKQRSFTFTISEQQSLSHYLTSPPPLETPSPRPTGSSTPIPFSEGACTPLPSTTGVQLKESSYHDSCLQFSPGFTDSLPQSSVTPSSNSENRVTTTLILPVTKPKRPGPLVVSKPTEELNNVQIFRGATNTESIKCISGNKEVAIDGCHPKETLPEPPLNKEDASDKPGCCSSISKTVLQLEVPSIQVTMENDESISIGTVAKEAPRLTLSTGLRETEIPGGALPSQCAVNAPRDSSSAVGATSSRTASKVTVSPKTAQITEPPLLPKKEVMTLLKNPDRPKAPRKKPGGGWARLVKHLTVEPEEPKFPEQQQAEVTNEKRSGDEGLSIEAAPQSRTSRANKMWDALLYHMATSTKGQEKPGTEIAPQLPLLRSRLPLLLHRPRFDARKLKEAASRPLRRVTAFFCRRISENKPPPAATFNRTASGWSIHKEDTDKIEGEAGEKEGDVQE
ncbi:hypothetical protein XENTR_v10010914 [Xenopus tropicalis]|uniref:Uncharacterized protein C6orf132 homolog n=1 Tax=Xenopus tropicalis TaxID=8364 RepID=A0A8J0R2C6_XENTR|nr:uncharacterized protein C6orf132 homolog [Xenopus tropicalis]KAE8606873.1 hypothetical protein XENTR_v10010914 [Xenopus tropicalis]|eukprot:XP_004913525.1 PREDICTED: uncharacterized protein C6orf132 homolog [Xenopus tropicalis]